MTARLRLWLARGVLPVGWLLISRGDLALINEALTKAKHRLDGEWSSVPAQLGDAPSDFNRHALDDPANKILRMAMWTNSLAASDCSHYDRIRIDANAAHFLACRQQEALVEAGYRVVKIDTNATDDSEWP